MADLSPEEDQELKQTKEIHRDGVSVRRDFSVIHSKQLKKNHLFLGPARFVNVSDCFSYPLQQCKGVVLIRHHTARLQSQRRVVSHRTLHHVPCPQTDRYRRRGYCKLW